MHKHNYILGFLLFLFLKTSYSQDIDTHFNELNKLAIDYYNSGQEEKFLEIYFEQKDLIDKVSDDHVRLMFYKYRSTYFNKIGLYRESIKNAQDGLAFFLNKDTKKTGLTLFHTFLIFQDLADNYIHLNEKDSAAYTYKKAIKFVHRFYENDSIDKLYDKDVIIASAYNNLGIHFNTNLKESDSALYYLKKAYKKMEKLPDTLQALSGSVRDNIAKAYFRKGEFKKAKLLFAENFNFYDPNVYPQFIEKTFNEREDYKRWMNAGFYLAKMQIRLKETTQARALLKKLDSLMNTYKHPSKPHSKLLYNQTMEEFYVSMNDYDRSRVYVKRAEFLLDSINRASEAKQIFWNSLSQKNLLRRFKEKIELEQSKLILEKEKEQKKLLNIIVILLFIMLITVLLIINYRQRLKNSRNKKKLIEKELMLSQFKNDRLNNNIENIKSDLSQFALRLSQNLDWIEELSVSLKNVKTLKGRFKVKALDDLSNKVEDKIAVNKLSKDFQQRVKTLKSSFYSKLLERFPDLTSSELRLCVVIRLGMDNHDIGILYNINKSSVHQKRYRLRKKLNLSGNDDLYQFLKKF